MSSEAEQSNTYVESAAVESDTEVSPVNESRTTDVFKFNKKPVQRARHGSVQSVLSTISLRSMMNLNRQSQAQQMQSHTELPAINTSVTSASQIQSPAIPASKRRGSFEIGQRLPFTDDGSKKSTDRRESECSSDEDEQRKLTTDALRKLSFLSQGSMARTSSGISSNYQPAEVDIGGRDSGSGGREFPTDQSQGNRAYSGRASNGTCSRVSPLIPQVVPLPQTLSQTLSGKVSQAQLVVDGLAQKSGSGDSLVLHDVPQEMLQHLVGGGVTGGMAHGMANGMANGTSNVTNGTVLVNGVTSSGAITVAAGTINGGSTLISGSSALPLKSPLITPRKPIQQMSHPKKPLYVPAVLRATSETNLKKSDLKIINDKKNNPINAHLLSSSPGTHENSVEPVISPDLEPSNASVRSASSIVSYAHSLQRKLRQSLKPDDSQPTRRHWVDDADRTRCKYCLKGFTLFERRHHCRRCGDIFCSQHVRHWLFLNQQAQFEMNGMGVLARVCDMCLKDYENLVRAGKVDDEVREEVEDKLPRNRQESVVGAVPADWSWSSF